MSSPDNFPSSQPSTPTGNRRRNPASRDQPIEPQSSESSSPTSAGGFTPPIQSRNSSTTQLPQNSGSPSGAPRAGRRRRKKKAQIPECLPLGDEESPESDDHVPVSTAPEQASRTTPEITEPWDQSPLEQLQQKFYERLALLYALDPTQGERPGHVKTPEVDDSDSSELRRHFLNAIAYVCDTKKGGPTCTASALQELNGSKLLVLASNSTISATTKDEIKSILYKLSQFDGQDPDEINHNGQLLEDQIIRKMVRLSGAGRMKDYLRFLRINFRMCRRNDSLVNSLGPEFRTILDYLERMFKALDTEGKSRSEPAESSVKADTSANGLYRVITQCFSIMKKREMARVRKQLQIQNRLVGPFWELQHAIGRLAKFRTVAKTLIRTAQVHPQLFPDIEVQVLQNPGKPWGLRPPVLNTSVNPDIQSTIERILMDIVDSDENLAATYLLKLYRLNETLEMLQVPGKSKKESIVTESFEENYLKFISPKCKPLVHAEALILAHSERTEGFTFVDGDRFIGCSKLSCYLCDLYFAAVPGTNTLPTHNNIYPMWRLPDRIPEDEQMAILSGMVSRFGTEIKRTLDHSERRRVLHPDSTTGVTCPTYKPDLDCLDMDSFGSDVGEADSEEEDGGSESYGEASGQPQSQESSREASGVDSIARGVGDMRMDMMPGSFPG